MRSVLTAVDYIKDIDGSFKVLELNTGISIVPKIIEPYFNKIDFDNLLIENNITTIDFVVLRIGFSDVIDGEVINEEREGLPAYLIRNYPDVQINLIPVDMNSKNTPTLINEPNKLIIRQSYDSSALIDETYAKDNFEFLKLLYDNDSNSIPKTYFNDVDLGFDSIGTVIRNNGNYPNFIIKERYPTTKYNVYPKPLKIETQQELIDLKNSLSNNLILQEYIINLNDLENGKLKTYRTIGLIYGSDLNSINLFEPFIHTNNCSIDIDVDYDNNNEVQIWERTKYIQKYRVKSNLIYNSDNTNLIIKSDGSLVNPENLSVNDSVKSINLYNLPNTDNPLVVSSYKESQDNVFSGSTFTNSLVKRISSTNEGVWIRNLFLEDGLKFSDVENSEVLILRDGFIRFMTFINVKLTDQVVVVNKINDEFSLKNIVSESFIFGKEKIFTIDVEDVDTYLTMDESTINPTFYIIQHNYGECLCWTATGIDWFCESPCPADGQTVYTGYDRGECEGLFGAGFICNHPCCQTQPYNPNVYAEAPIFFEEEEEFQYEGYFYVSNSGASAYTINGASNPTLTLIRGREYVFIIDAPGHPFWIKTSPNTTGTGRAYQGGGSGWSQGQQQAEMVFYVDTSAPNRLYYICQFHGSMQGEIIVINGNNEYEGIIPHDDCGHCLDIVLK